MKCEKITEIILKTHYGLFREICHNIIYCKASAKHSTIYLKENNASNLIPKCLKHVEGCLHEKCFVRVHHNCIVNLNHIKEVNRKQNIIKMTNGVELTVSFRKKPNFIRMFQNKFKLI